LLAALRPSHCARYRTATGLCSNCQPTAVKLASRSTNRPSPVIPLLRAVETFVLQGSVVLGQSRGRELTYNDDWCRPALQPDDRKIGCVLTRLNVKRWLNLVQISRDRPERRKRLATAFHERSRRGRLRLTGTKSRAPSKSVTCATRTRAQNRTGLPCARRGRRSSSAVGDQTGNRERCAARPESKVGS
jgi:hypothetical protein